MSDEQLLWVERYRPHEIDDCILPEAMKKTFQEFVNKNAIPNMLLSGGPGMGKTTVARALCDELGMDYILLNSSSDGGVDTMRTKVTGYASAVSLNGGRKVIILDEADQLTQVVGGAQWALRGMIEEFADNCSFILTCNMKNRIIEALHSRCTVIDFKIPNDVKPKIAAAFLKRVETILKDEAVEYDRKAVIELVKKHFPDFRRVINELQRHAISGKIDAGIFANSEIRISEAVEFLKAKDFAKLRKWVGENVDNDTDHIMREIYDGIYDIVKPQYIPAAVVKVAEYMYKGAFCADKEINLMALLSEIMLEFEMKA